MKKNDCGNGDKEKCNITQTAELKMIELNQPQIYRLDEIYIELGYKNYPTY